ncbi:MAG: tyrosine-type recombinase/integrase [Myxococcales bacterium]|nr:tyrosine-type recombinase/integrase [Myxococcales bacterium]
MDRTVVVAPSAELVELAASATAYAVESLARNTLRAYESDWRGFVAWCRSHGLEPLCAEEATVVLYLTESADMGKKVSTVGRRLAAISHFQRLEGCEAPTDSAAVRTTLRGIRRRRGAPQNRKAPLVVEELRRVVMPLPDDLRGARDRAILTVGFGAARRRAEIVALDVSDLTFVEDGLTVLVRRSKTDQEGVGFVVGVPFGSVASTCPVLALRRWLDLAGITAGPVFRSINIKNVLGPRLSDRAVAEIIKKRVAAVGLDPERYSGHSLRAGLATSAAKAGKTERSIMKQTGHESPTMLRRYIRIAELFTDNAADGVL